MGARLAGPGVVGSGGYGLAFWNESLVSVPITLTVSKVVGRDPDVNKAWEKDFVLTEDDYRGIVKRLGNSNVWQGICFLTMMNTGSYS